MPAFGESSSKRTARLGTRVITNQQLGSSFEQAHLPFGTALNAESTGSINRRFTSYDRSARTGLDYAINRTYDSKQGRFTQVDPIGFKASDLEHPQTLNLYTYCANDPINHTDHDGLFWGTIKRLFQAIGRALSAIGNVIARVLGLGNTWVRIGLTILQAVVSFGLGVFGALKIILSAVSVASFAATALQVGGLFLQGRIGTLIRVIGLMIIGTLIGIVEDTIVNRVLDARSFSDFFRKAWQGFKDGLDYVKEAFKRGWETLIPALGFNCGPGWGHPGERPAGNLDKICRKHDEDSENTDLIQDAKSRYTAKIKADRLLVRRSLVSSTRTHLIDLAIGGRPGTAGEVYRSLLPVAFGIRILYFRYRRARIK
ncbi:MAG: hypothetical protein C4325_10355 [Blastocatellia bacterium]